MFTTSTTTADKLTQFTDTFVVNRGRPTPPVSKMRQLFTTNNMQKAPPILPRAVDIIEGLPTMSMRVTFHQEVKGKTVKNRLILKIYDSFDSYAVLSPDKAVGKDCGCFSLKNYAYKVVPSGVLTREHKFQVVPRDCEGTVMTFSSGSRQETAKWVAELTRLAGPVETPIALLRPSNSPRSSISSVGSGKRSSLLPALEEEENNEE